MYDFVIPLEGASYRKFMRISRVYGSDFFEEAFDKHGVRFYQEFDGKCFAIFDNEDDFIMFSMRFC